MWRSLLLSTLLLSSCAAQSHTDDTPKACSHARAAARGLPPSPAALFARDRAGADTNVLHYDLTLDIDPENEHLTGLCVITVDVLTDGLTQFQVRLGDAFTIPAIEIAGVPLAWQRLDPETLEVTLDRPYSAGETFDLAVSYAGQPESANWGSIVFTEEDGEPLVYTLSQPWFAYTWWPTKDDLNDKATGDLRLSVPAELTVAANGAFLGQTDLGDGRIEFHYRTQYQTVPYLFCFGASVYNYFTEVWSYGDVTMPLDFYIPPARDTQENRDKWLRSGDMLTVFSDVFGLYPFAAEKYGIYWFGFGGGMEHQTISGQGTFSEWITAHEVGHQWWGDMVTCATWHDIWLNEGFATYTEAIWKERKGGDVNTQALLDHMANRRPGRVDDSVYCYDLSNVGRIFSGDFSYRKGAWVLHQLRGVVGDDAFFDILAAYRAAFEYSSATTADFQQVVEDVVGADFDWFFSQWVYDIGAPSYVYGWREVDVAGRPHVELYVEQVQSTDYPLFEMPIDMVVTAGGGAETTHTIWNDAGAEHFLIPLTEPASALAFDPQKWVLWEDAAEVDFAPGPAKIAATSPEPDAVLADPVSEVRLTFHKYVQASAGDFSLTDRFGQPVAFDFTYDANAHSAVLTPVAPLAAGPCTVTVRDTILDTETGLALDGEFEHTWDQPALPSGDGLAGGDAVFTFIAPMAADLDGDGDVDQADLGLLLASYDYDAGGDIDGDGDTDQADLGVLLANFGYQR